MPAACAAEYTAVALRGTYLCRDLINTPAADMGPAELEVHGRCIGLQLELQGRCIGMQLGCIGLQARGVCSHAGHGQVG